MDGNNNTGGGLCLVIKYKQLGWRIDFHFRRTNFNALLNDGIS